MKGFFTGKDYPCIFDLAAYVLLFFVSSFAAVLILSLVRLMIQLDNDSFMALSYIVSFVVLLALTFIYRAVRSKVKVETGIKTFFFRPKFNFKMTLWGIILMIMSQIVTEPLVAMDAVSERAYYDMWSTMGVVMIAVSVSVAPIVEEIFFRAIIAGDLAKKRGAVFSVIVSSLLFSAAHFSCWAQVIPSFFGGLILAYVFLSTGSVWSAVFVHFVNNLTSQIYLLYSPTYEDFSKPLREIVGVDAVYYIIYGLSAIILLVTLSVGVARLSRKYSKMSGDNADRAVSAEKKTVKLEK